MTAPTTPTVEQVAHHLVVHPNTVQQVKTLKDGTVKAKVWQNSFTNLTNTLNRWLAKGLVTDSTDPKLQGPKMTCWVTLDKELDA